MSAIQLDLTSSDHEALLRASSAAGFASPAAYLQQLILADQEIRRSLTSVCRDPDVEALVIAGIESGNAGEVSADDWDTLRGKFRETSH